MGTVVDNPLHGAAFSLAVSESFRESLVDPLDVDLTVIDRTLFLLDARIHAVSPRMVLQIKGVEHEIDLDAVKTRLLANLEGNLGAIAPAEFSEGDLSVRCAVPRLSTDAAVAREFYLGTDPDPSNSEQLQAVVSAAYVHEITKSIESVTLGSDTLDMNSLSSFAQRIAVVESLPATLVRSVVRYIEEHRALVDSALSVGDAVLVPDASWFSV
jgi:hypothetical protein